jgi:8-oxo-dGTP pyrophosphatase MutT (NUDIX family)
MTESGPGPASATSASASASASASETIPQAATVLLLRPGAAGVPEVFTITRADSLAFSAGVSAFPGGRIDVSDELGPHLWEGSDLAGWGRALGLEPAAAGKVLVGVVRETFEETGVLLARQLDGQPVDGSVVAALPADTRRRVEEHEVGFGTLLDGLGLRPDVGALRPLSRWITPPGRTRRYDTFFFLAALPAGQHPGTLSFEGTASRWTTAADALADFRAGHHRLMPPTWSQFRALDAARTMDEALRLPPAMAPVSPTVLGGAPPAVAGFPGHGEYAVDLACGFPTADGPPVQGPPGS